MSEPIDLDAKRLEAFAKPKKPISEKRLAANRANGKKGRFAPPIDYGPSRGPGWGGPAKGEGKDPRDTPLEIRQQATAIGKARAPEKEARAAALLDNLETLAMDKEQPGGVRVMASSAALDRLEGKPVQRTITANADDLARLSDDELRAELERFGRTGA